MIAAFFQIYTDFYARTLRRREFKIAPNGNESTLRTVIFGGFGAIRTNSDRVATENAAFTLARPPGERIGKGYA